jgi:dipeptidyl aminopeptidase/acylaminoacyl peptidase
MSAIRPADLFDHVKIIALNAVTSSSVVAFVTSQPDRGSDGYNSALWALHTDGGRCDARQLTHEGSASSPKVAPGGDRIAFLSSRQGTHPKAYLISLDGGEADPVPNVGDLEIVQLLQWSSDGTRLLVLATLPYAEDGQDDINHAARPHVIQYAPFKLDGGGYTVGFRRHLFEVRVDGSAPPRALTSGDFDVAGGAWSPDGLRLAYTASSGGTQRHRSNLWLIEMDAPARPLTTHMATVMGPVWSNTGTRLAFAGNTVEGDSASYLYVWDEEQVAGPLGPNPLETGEIIWSPDDARLAAVASDQGLFPIMDIGADGSAPALRDLGQVQVSLLAASGSGPVCVYSSWCVLDEVYLLSWDSRTPSCCATSINRALSDRLRMHCELERFEVPDGEEGAETIDVWVFSPWEQQEGELPLLVDMHGGPHSVALMDFASHVYLYALVASGWRVIAPNAVGSSGYGEDFADRLRGRWGRLDFPQVQSVVRQLRDAGRAAPFVAAAGKSYGGFLSAWSIANGPEFSAAVISAPVANVASHSGTSDSGYYVGPYSMGGEMDDVRERYDALSPVEYFGKVRRPILLLNGDQDQRCPVGQAEELFTRLLRLGCPHAAMVVYPGGTHSLAASGRPSHREDYHRRVVDFLVESFEAASREGQGSEQSD